MAKPLVLLIDDSDDAAVRQALERDSYAVLQATEFAQIIKMIKAGLPEVIILELLLAEENGLTLMAKIRKHTDAPIMIVSKKNSLIDKVIAFQAGADDYMIKPVQMQELLARVAAHARRYRRTLSNRPEILQDRRVVKIRFAGWVLDRARMQLNSDQGQPVRLTTKEFRLLEVFALAPNQVFSREQLLDASRGYGFNVTERAIDTQIVRLRRKIDGITPTLIQSISGVGYIFSTVTENLSE